MGDNLTIKHSICLLHLITKFWKWSWLRILKKSCFVQEALIIQASFYWSCHHSSYNISILWPSDIIGLSGHRASWYSCQVQWICDFPDKGHCGTLARCNETVTLWTWGILVLLPSAMNLWLSQQGDCGTLARCNETVTLWTWSILTHSLEILMVPLTGIVCIKHISSLYLENLVFGYVVIWRVNPYPHLVK